MNEIAQRSYSPSQLALIRRTVAKDCNQEEFDLFIEICKHQGLDPFRKQIYAFVFKKNRRAKGDDGQWRDVEERQLTPVTSIDGYRSKAARCGDYRPDDQEPSFEYSEAAKSESTNPIGIVKCTVRAYKFGPDKQWYPCVGTVFWDELAPIIEDGEWKDSKFVGNGTMMLDKKKPNWRRMGRTMIAKCAEAQSLRKGWPEEMSGLYVQEEMDKALLDLTATEAVEAYERDERLKRTASKDTIPAIFEMSEGLQLIPLGKFADRVIEHVKTFDDAMALDFWKDQNTRGLQQFWAYASTDALDLKKKLEQVRIELAAKPSGAVA
jgi:phage recombination protein Bet